MHKLSSALILIAIMTGCSNPENGNTKAGVNELSSHTLKAGVSEKTGANYLSIILESYSSQVPLETISTYLSDLSSEHGVTHINLFLNQDAYDALVKSYGPEDMAGLSDDEFKALKVGWLGAYKNGELMLRDFHKMLRENNADITITKGMDRAATAKKYGYSLGHYDGLKNFIYDYSKGTISHSNAAKYFIFMNSDEEWEYYYDQNPALAIFRTRIENGEFIMIGVTKSGNNWKQFDKLNIPAFSHLGTKNIHAGGGTKVMTFQPWDI